MFKYFVVKIPNATCHLNFLNGCHANWSERNYCKMFKPINDEMKVFYDKVAPSFFCSYFGLFQVMARCEPLKRTLTDEEREYFKDVCQDVKIENFGYYKGRLVCIDYAD